MKQKSEPATHGRPSPARTAGPILRVEDLSLYFRASVGIVRAVERVSFELERGRSLTIVGESGCGKTSLARAILRLLPRNIDTYRGRVFLNGTDVMKLSDERFRQDIRWKQMSLVSQAAMNSLNPVVKVGQQVAEPLLLDHHMSKEKAFTRAREVFQTVGIPSDFLNRYAFELSGGMRQRTILAMALVTSPSLVILDEPTSALDVLTQANIMNTLKGIKQELGLSFVLITHDIATSSELADEVLCMYAGQLVEHSKAERFYREPLHPYARKLMASVPTLRVDKKPEFITGQPPSLLNPPTGCRFAARCDKRFDRCQEEPPLFQHGDETVKCWLYENA
ncbi:MAG: ABC transporter ATP-binding protein [Dehalococcoidia bacterium]|nr:ABC transporter ATP-binding protein [Dehalococcoidia bacterium]